MTFWQEVALVFTEIGWIPAICIILGLIFIIIEIFQPGFGFFGITGAILVIVGIAVRVYNNGGGNPIIQVVVLVGVVALVLTIALLLMMWSMRKGWLSRTGFVQKSSAVNEVISDGTQDYSTLIGKVGVAKTVLRPSGNALIEGKIYSVVTEDSFIDKDTKIIVDSVEGVRIVVKEIKGDI